jgi:hypothetical protein
VEHDADNIREAAEWEQGFSRGSHGLKDFVFVQRAKQIQCDGKSPWYKNSNLIRVIRVIRGKKQNGGLFPSRRFSLQEEDFKGLCRS